MILDKDLQEIIKMFAPERTQTISDLKSEGKTVVKCANQDQYKWLYKLLHGKRVNWKFGNIGGMSGKPTNCVRISDTEGSVGSEQYYRDRLFYIVDFSRFILKCGLVDKYTRHLVKKAEKKGFESADGGWKYTSEDALYSRAKGESTPIYRNGKWRTMIPKVEIPKPKEEPKPELIRGQVYKALKKDNYCESIFRHEFSNVSKWTTSIKRRNIFGPETHLIAKQQPCRLATPAEIAELIQAEIKAGYVWTGKDLVKIEN